MTGVSTQTVSRVINKRPDVSPDTRRTVEAAITEHGFQPSAVARSLVQRRSHMLGVVVAGLRYFGVSQALNGIAEASEAAGYSIILKDLSSFSVPDIVPVVDFFVANRVEGIIFGQPQLGDNLRQMQEQLPPSAPPVIFLKAVGADGFNAICVDNVGGGRQATEHLLALGRRRIAHIAGPLAWREAEDRRDGWLAALEDAGVAAGPIVAGDWSAMSGAAACEWVLELDPEVDGLFAANDQMALGALQVANRRGIAIPGRLAVVGFDGVPEAGAFTPSLTPLRQPLAEMGELAVERVLAEINAEVAPPKSTILLPTELVIGDSAPMP